MLTDTKQQIREGRISIGQKIRKARLNAGLDLETCARALDLTPDQMAGLENDSSAVSLPQLEILSRICGVPTTYFWTEQRAPAAAGSALPPAVALAIRRRMIGVLLRQARLAAGKRLADCAQVLGVSTDTMAGYEYGQEDIAFHHLQALAEFLHVPLTYFVDEDLISDSERERHDLQMLAELPADVREFVLRPSNALYVRVAMLISSLPTETLRQIGEGLLDITL
jgi:transcriptional regulator with XRE-family HTH domain